MAKRLFLLYVLSLKGFFYRLRFDLGREITVAISSAAIFFLFFYIFNDFLNVEVRSLSEPMRESFSFWLSNTMFLIVSIIAGRKINAEKHDPASFVESSNLLGESPKTTKYLWLLRQATIILVSFVPAWFINQNYLYPYNGLTKLYVTLSMLALSYIAYKFKTSDALKTNDTEKPLLAETLMGPEKAMRVWRLKQMFFKNRLTQTCFSFAFLFSLMLGWASFHKAPMFVLVLITFMAGVMTASALAFQVSEDLEYSWAEKNLGISHESYIQTLSSIGYRLGFLIALISLITWITGALLNLKTLQLEQQLLLDGLKIAIITWVPSALVSSLAFQIEARKPAVTITSIFLTSLFIITAIFAHWLGLILVPVLIHYAKQYQSGRFYRA